jgi:hypothetical protein
MRLTIMRAFGAAVLLSAVGAMGAYVPAAAAEGETCSAATGSIKVSPALSETKIHVRQLKFKGTVSGCTGKFSSGRLTALFHGNKEIDCKSLTGPAETEDFTNGTASVRWAGAGTPNSAIFHIMMGFTASEEVGMTGEVGANEFAGTHLKGKLSLKFGTCAGTAKVKKGTFSFSEFVIA